MFEYRLYIDESGDHTYQNVDDLPHRYLGLTGIIIHKGAYDAIFQPYLEGLKRVYFCPDNDIDKRVILHRSDIRSFDGAFKVLLDPDIKSKWEQSILNYFTSLKSYANIFTVVMDKKQHLEKYPTETFDPYYYNLEVLLWRVRGYLVASRFIPTQADIIAESRNKTQDERLKEVYRTLRKDGSQNKKWGTAGEYKEAFPAPELWVEKKTANVAGLQIADLVATGLKLEILEREGKPLPVKKIPEFTKKLNLTVDPLINEVGRYLMK